MNDVVCGSGWCCVLISVKISITRKADKKRIHPYPCGYCVFLQENKKYFLCSYSYSANFSHSLHVLQCLTAHTLKRLSPLVRSGTGRTQWRWRTWMSAWYMRATSATTDVSTRQALTGVSASLDMCCKRTLSLVHKVQWRPPILFCHTVLIDISRDASTQESNSLCHFLFEIWFTVHIPVRKTPFVVICLHIHNVLSVVSLWSFLSQRPILPNNSLIV